MNTEEASNKKIAKNTVILYVRLMITTIVSLYTSRVVLSTLGFSDYGVYNVVGGIVIMFSFLNNGMVAASQRFISYEIGMRDKGDVKAVFGTSHTIHWIISITIGLIVEFVGYYLLNYKLNIPADRLLAANWVLQTSILGFMINVTNVPFMSTVVAHEHMGFYAFQSIIDVLLQLLVVYLLLIFSSDKLIVYGILRLLVIVLLSLILRVYTRFNFEECKSIFQFRKDRFKKMFEFALWSLLGNMGFSIKDQGANMVINVFCGTAVNAARGIALQVGAAIATFSSSFMTAINPQITQTYASGNVTRSRDLVYIGTRYSFYLLSLIAVPFMVNVDYVLKLWLGDVPPYTSVYVVFTLVSSLLYSMSQAVTYALQATGNIRVFQQVICVVMLLEIPLVYIFLKCGCDYSMIMVPTVFVNLIALVARISLLKKQVPIYSIRYYVFSIFFKNSIIFSIACGIAVLIKSQLSFGLLSFIVLSVCSELLILFLVFFCGLNSSERCKIMILVKQKLNL